ncbi:MAG TPA: hypothetical protein VHP58_06180 [Alphaproteobacteria bacterium]|nr:hypothetical protein [Alphaproteobacteria bacterium]
MLTVASSYSLPGLNPTEKQCADLLLPMLVIDVQRDATHRNCKWKVGNTVHILTLFGVHHAKVSEVLGDMCNARKVRFWHDHKACQVCIVGFVAEEDFRQVAEKVHDRQWAFEMHEFTIGAIVLH